MPIVVREFDIVTLDRVKKIDVEEDYDVWKEYAVKQNVHNAIISYLDIRKENFYSVKNTAEGKMFVTARGWEDLSRMMFAYEALNKKVEFDMIYQYIQNKKIAKDFAGYIELYNKYKKDYSISGILAGEIEDAHVDRLRVASFDEKLSVISLILGALNDGFKKADRQDMLVTELHGILKEAKSTMLSNFAKDKRPEDIFLPVLNMRKNAFDKKKKAGTMKKEEERFDSDIINILDGYLIGIKESGKTNCEEGFEVI
ncbi:MAG: ATPase, partial [Clostridia bacterium]|nr:ATPase [Clostridia bacterium]